MRIWLQKFQKIPKPHFTYIFSYAAKQRTSSRLVATACTQFLILTLYPNYWQRDLRSYFKIMYLRSRTKSSDLISPSRSISPEMLYSLLAADSAADKVK